MEQQKSAYKTTTEKYNFTMYAWGKQDISHV